MALLWIEGFEGFGTTTGGPPLPYGAMARKYLYVNGEISFMDIEAGRISGYSLEIGFPENYFGTAVLTTDDTLIVGCAFKNSGGWDHVIIALRDGVDSNINLRYLAAGGELGVYLADAELETTAGLGLLIDTWYWIEMKVKTDNAAGTYDVKLGDVSILSDSGIDTQSGSNAYSDHVRFYGSRSNPHFDDIYICDSTGGDNNDFLGNCKVSAILPNGDDTANWTTNSPSANHWENVDENESDEDTSYNEEDTVNLTDLYDYEDLGVNTGTVYGLQINTECRETDANSFDIKLPASSNGTQSDGAALAVGSTSWVTKTRLVETDPDTGNLWISAAIDAAKFGIKVG